MRTAIGGVFSFAIVVMVLLYAGLKAMDVIERRNPIINILSLPDAVGDDDAVNVKESTFRMAFSLENSVSKVVLDDERYIRWVIRHYGQRDGARF